MSAEQSLDFEQIHKVAGTGTINDMSITIIDVRNPSEFKAGHVDNAHNLPVAELSDALALPPKDFKDAYGFELPALDSETEGILVYCQRGGRAQRAFDELDSKGYKSNLFAYLPGWGEYSQKI
ncbi:hypothetical protein EV174_002486 [Coemansia sp. RSA 2320]|nr:hypothetical protein EV174_002486 [Coemansia sp. RSA 2320]